MVTVKAILFIGLISTTVFAQGSFTKVLSMYSGNSALSFPSIDTGYAASFNGKILRTTDGGNNWFIVFDDYKMKFISMQFIDAKTGWAVGGASSVHYTRDAGVTWQKRYLNVPPEPMQELVDVSFIDHNNGAVVTMQGVVYMTSDGGNTWVKIHTGVWHDLTGIRWIDRNTLVAIGYATILLSRDRGITWSIRDSTEGVRYQGVGFSDNTTGYVVSQQGAVRWTSDGGETWRKLTVATAQKRVAVCDTENILIARGGDGSGWASYSINGGFSWDQMRLSNCEMRDVASVNPNLAYFGGDCTMMKYEKTPSAGPRLKFSSRTIDHGSVLVGTTSRRTLRIWNTGAEDALIDNVALEGLDAALWSMQLSRSIIPPNAFAELHLVFAPLEQWSRSASLVIQSNDRAIPVHSLQLVGFAKEKVIEIETSSIDFGSALVKSSVLRTLRIKNVSSATKLISVNPHKGGSEFTCPIRDFALTPGESFNLPISFVPRTQGLKESSILLDLKEYALTPTVVTVQGVGLRPVLTVSKTVVDFGEVYNRTAKFDTIVIRNTGDYPLSISRITTSGANEADFRIMEVPSKQLAPGGESMMVLRFFPLATGLRDADVNFETNDPLAMKTVLSLKGQSVAPIMTVNKTQLDFGTQFFIQLKEESITLHNTGSTNLRIHRIAIEGSGSNNFSITKNPKFVLNPNEKGELKIRFTPTVEGVIEANLIIESTDNNSPMIIPLTGVGVKPRLVLTGTGLSFGSVRVFTTSESNFVIENMDERVHPIPAMQLEGNDKQHFELIPPAVDSIQPKSKADVLVRFRPTQTGSRVASIRFIAGDPIFPGNTYTITGTGTAGIIMASPPSLAFGNVTIDRFHKKAVTLRNSGGLPLVVQSCTINGPDKDWFSVITRCDTTIPLGGRKDLIVQFIPVRLGMHEATLHVFSDDPFTAEKIIPLSGNALLTSTEPANAAHQTLTLEQNAPNPFHHETEISFSIPSHGQVRLTVYDIHGRHVKTLFEGRLEGGEHRRRISLGDVPTGLYLYRLESEGALAQRQMLFIR